MKSYKRGFVSYIVAAILVIFVAGMIVFNFYMNSLKPIKNLEKFVPNHVTQIISADDAVIKTFGVYKITKVGSADIPKRLKLAFISIEDKNFYKHEGYDLVALLRSTLVNIKAGRSKQGASTITQQLSRILFLSNEKTFNRKIKEFIILFFGNRFYVGIHFSPPINIIFKKIIPENFLDIKQNINESSDFRSMHTSQQYNF